MHTTAPSILDGLFPATVRADESRPDDFGGPLLAAEYALIREATEIRLREFTGGRRCARRLVQALGVEEHPILATPERAPIWPAGVVGTISHTAGRCFAAVARREAVSMLGLDVEVDRSLDASLWDIVCTPEELAWIASMPVQDQCSLATLIFSAKECGYKAQFPVTRAFLGFHEGHIAVGMAGTFTVTFPPHVTAQLPTATLHGRWAVREGLMLTAVAVAAERVSR